MSGPNLAETKHSLDTIREAAECTGEKLIDENGNPTWQPLKESEIIPEEDDEEDPF